MIKNIFIFFSFCSQACYSQYNYHLIKLHPQAIIEIGEHGNVVGLGISYESKVSYYLTGEFSIAINQILGLDLTSINGKLLYYFSKKRFVGPYAGVQLGFLTSYHYPFSGFDFGFHHFLNERWMAKGHVGLGSFLGWRNDHRNNYLSCDLAAAYMFKSRQA
ncbi:MAG: hypothetical protein H0X62_00185 [Bacteroidetes bacterium]|nr:hypothetical protein [Bacteroidota bacterium]